MEQGHVLRRVVIHDEADWEILKLANEKGKFAIQIGQIPDPEIQDAFERGIDHEWWTLVDIGPIAHKPGVVMRVFRLTAAGRDRHRELSNLFS